VAGLDHRGFGPGEDVHLRQQLPPSRIVVVAAQGPAQPERRDRAALGLLRVAVDQCMKPVSAM
jgi:hypothetical protein